MWEARHKTAFIVRSEGTQSYYKELDLKCMKAFLHTDQAWFVSTPWDARGFDQPKGNKAYKTTLATKEGKYWIQNNAGFLSWSFYVLKFSVQNLFYVPISMTFYSFVKSVGK